MSDSAGITKATGLGLEKLVTLQARAKSQQGAFAAIYKIYQALQVQRFETENASEGSPWAALNPKYKAYKPKRYGGGPRRASKKHPAGNWSTYPFKGEKMMIGTGWLAGAAIGSFQSSPFTQGNENHRAMFTETTMTITVEESGDNGDGNRFDYAHFANEHRPFMTFSEPSLDLMKDKMKSYIITGGVE